MTNRKPNTKGNKTDKEKNVDDSIPSSKSKTAKRSRRNKSNRNMDGSNSTNGRTNNANSKSIFGSSDNDASWYTRYPELARDASKIPFTTPLGKYPIVDTSVTSSKFKVGGEAFSVPGIMAINWIPTIGQSDSANSPVNLVAREAYSFVRHANSGHSNYDAPDMMMYILAMDSLYSFYAAMVRVYGVMMLYNGMNRYMPKRLVEAMGFDFDDISQNMAQFRWLINQVAYKLTALYVPSGMTYFERHIWLNSGVYVDSASIKAQTYVFKQSAYYVYNATAATNYAATLKYTPVPSNLTLAKCTKFVNDMLNPILADEDMNIISGDMLRAFGVDNLFTVSPISEDYVVVPSYSQEVLSQIQNLTILGEPDTTRSTNNGYHADIVQRIKVDSFTPGIYQVLTFVGDSVPQSAKTDDELYAWICNGYDRLITMLNDNPTSDEILVATRLTNIIDIFGVEETTVAGSKYNRCIFGADILSTEVVTGVNIYSVDADDDTVSRSLRPFTLVGASAKKYPNTLSIEMRTLSLVSAFDWHPNVYLMHSEGDDGSVTLDGTLVEFNNFTPVDKNDLRKLHARDQTSLD